MKKVNNSRKGKVMFWLITIVIVICIGFGIRGVKNYFNHVAQVRQTEENPQLQQQRHDKAFMEEISSPAIKAYQKNFQILPSIAVAQAIVESNWGTSRLYQVAKNPFGIKGQYHGRSVSYDTAEYVNGKRKTVSANFRKYPTLEAAIVDHDNALNHGFIHRQHVMSYITDAKLLQKNHYATDPNYAKKLISVIKQYHLNRYDLEALNGKSTY